MAGLQEVPLNVNASEPLSTATQKAVDGHDTDAMPGRVLVAAPLMLGAELHVLPLNRKADESRASTAMQNVTVGQDTESGSPRDEDSTAGLLHLAPSYIAA